MLQVPGDLGLFTYRMFYLREGQKGRKQPCWMYKDAVGVFFCEITGWGSKFETAFSRTAASWRYQRCCHLGRLGVARKKKEKAIHLVWVDK